MQKQKMSLVMLVMICWCVLEFVGVNAYNYDITFMERCEWYERQNFLAGPLGWRCINLSDIKDFEKLYERTRGY
jgi:hypothetical protein